MTSQPSIARRRRPLIILISAATLVVALIATGAVWYLNRDLTIQGVVRLHDGDLAVTDGFGGCAGQGGFADLAGGTPVAVLDPAGVVLQVGRLTSGHWESATVCLFTFAVTVPAGKGNYGVQIGHRDVLRYSEAELGSVLDLSIGQA